MCLGARALPQGQGEEMGALSMEVMRQRRTLATMETHRESFVPAQGRASGNVSGGEMVPSLQWKHSVFIAV